MNFIIYHKNKTKKNKKITKNVASRLVGENSKSTEIREKDQKIQKIPKNTKKLQIKTTDTQNHAESPHKHLFQKKKKNINYGHLLILLN